MLMVLWMSAVLAGQVTVNGIDVTDALRGQTFEGATVTFDEQGDIHISAPGYRIEIEGAAPAETVTAPDPAPPAEPPAPPAGAGVAAGRWWLATEDSGSTGHTVEVFLNGSLVRTIRSGEPQLIFDIGPWLRPGDNDVRIVSESVAPGGGALYVYLGSGTNETGTVVLGQPDVQFGVGASREGTREREYRLTVD